MSRLANTPHAARAVEDVDLVACDREPIHTPGSIQPHGHLLAFEGPELVLAHASAAAAGVLLPEDLDAAFGKPLERVLRGEPVDAIGERLRRLPDGGGSVQLGRFRAPSEAAFQAIAHRSPDGFTVLELEAAVEGTDGSGATPEGLYPLLRNAFDRLASAPTGEELAARAAEEIRRLTGFDRALVYCFDDDWNGIVLAEHRNERLPSYLGLRFPASDVPAQARRLYEANRHRLIPEIDYTPVPVVAAPRHRAGDPLDLGLAALRSVSPVHLEYLRNMGTPASMSFSLLRGERLWGLLSCHHHEPRRVPYAVRGACDLIAQMLAVRTSAMEEGAYARERARLKELEGRLLVWMAEAERFADGLIDHPTEFCAYTGAAGAAVLTQTGCALIGQTPPEPEVRRIADWLVEEHGVEDVFATSSLGSLLPGAAGVVDVASGLLAVPISGLYPSFVLWFRPEVVRTVTWGGDPRKPTQPAGGRLHPRRSFEAWKETVRGRATPWSAAEVEAARDLRSAIVRIVLRRAEERAELTGQLERINKELAAFSYSVSHDLRAPFRHIIGYAELLRQRAGEALDAKSHRFLDTIVEASRNAGALVDALLNFAHVGRAQLARSPVSMAELLDEVRCSLEPEIGGRRVEWRVAPLPSVVGDATLLRQVLQNLLSNAVKYTRGRSEAVIEVGCEAGETEFVLAVRDNGVGFEMAYAHKLFGVFQRLHRPDEFEGVGIGLANVRRIVERHGGRTWAEGALDRGASFFFTLPREAPAADAR